MALRCPCGYSSVVGAAVLKLVVVVLALLLVNTRGSRLRHSVAAAAKSLDTASCDRLVHMYAEPKSGTNYLEEAFLAVGQILCGSRQRSSLTTNTSTADHHHRRHRRHRRRILNGSSSGGDGDSSALCHGFTKSISVRGGGRGFSFILDTGSLGASASASASAAAAAAAGTTSTRGGARRVCFVMKDKFELPNSGKMCQSHLFPVSGLGGWPFSAPCGIEPHHALVFPSVPSTAEITSGENVAECATTCAAHAVVSSSMQQQQRTIEHKSLRGSGGYVNSTTQSPGWGFLPPRIAYVYLHRDPRNTAISACFHASRVPANATPAELGECLQKVFGNVAMRMEARRLFFHLVAAAATPADGPAVSFLNYEAMLHCPVVAFRLLAKVLLLDGVATTAALKEAAQATSAHGEPQYQVATLRDAGHRTFRDYGLSDTIIRWMDDVQADLDATIRLMSDDDPKVTATAAEDVAAFCNSE